VLVIKYNQTQYYDSWSNMKTILRELSVSVKADDNELIKSAAKKLNIAESDILSLEIQRKSLDARNKSDIRYKYTLILDIKKSNVTKLLNQGKLKEYTKPEKVKFVFGKRSSLGRPVIIGAGPCGLFAAYTLAKNGYRPLILERGKRIGERKIDVDELHRSGKLNPESNICFGEGGAGTFSDGKLTTRIKDLRAKKVLETLVLCGADEKIKYIAKPHLGTDGMQKIIKALSKEIINLGGEIRFNAKLIGIKISDGKVTTAEYLQDEVEYEEQTNILVLATGHSAKDTYEMLHEVGVNLEKKSFAVGFRIEHKREHIDFAQYGEFAGKYGLSSAEYSLSAKSGDRGVYSFCMCPGGVVVCSASSNGELCINGMSYKARDMENSNSAIVVTLKPEDSEDHPLGGLKFIEDIEKKAYNIAYGYHAPVQKTSDYMLGKKTVSFDNVIPSYLPGVVSADLNEIMPKFVNDGIKEGLKIFDRRIKGFIENGVLTGVETRTSSPIRITRGENLMSTNAEGLYPGGEGAGYAGGIISAATDGIRIAEEIMKSYSPK